MEELPVIIINDDDNPESGLGAATELETAHSSLGELATSPDAEVALEMSAVPPSVRKALDDVRLATGGLPIEPRTDHAPYIASWLKVLQADSRAIFTAASKAQAAADHLATYSTGSTGGG